MSRENEQFIGVMDQTVVDGFAADVGFVPNRTYGRNNPNKRVDFSQPQNGSMRAGRRRQMSEISDHVDRPVKIGKINRFW